MIGTLLRKKFREADAILIGASNGLSITEGLHLFADNAAFDEIVWRFQTKYGLGCIFAGHDGRMAQRGGKVGLLGSAHPSLLRAVPAYAGDERFEGHCGRERLLCRHQTEKVTLNCVASIRRKSMRSRGNWFTMQCARPCHDTLYSSLGGGRKLSAAEQGRPCAYRVGAALSQVRRSHGHPHGRGSENDSGYRCPGTVPKLSENLPRKETGGSGAGHWLAQSADQGSR